MFWLLLLVLIAQPRFPIHTLCYVYSIMQIRKKVGRVLTTNGSPSVWSKRSPTVHPINRKWQSFLSMHFCWIFFLNLYQFRPFQLLELGARRGVEYDMWHVLYFRKIVVRSANHSEASGTIFGTLIVVQEPICSSVILLMYRSVAEGLRLEVYRLQVCPRSHHQHLKARFCKDL